MLVLEWSLLSRVSGPFQLEVQSAQRSIESADPWSSVLEPVYGGEVSYRLLPSDFAKSLVKHE